MVDECFGLRAIIDKVQESWGFGEIEKKEV